MDPKLLEEALLRALERSPNTVSVTLAGLVIAGLVTAVGALYAWAQGLSARFAEKVEQLAKGSQEREDARAKLAEEQCSIRLRAVEDRCARLEAARDLAVTQHATVLRDAHAATLERLSQNTEALEVAAAALGDSETQPPARRR